MADFVTEGATLKCSFGDQASTLKVPQPHGSFIEGKAQATVDDFIPMFNVQPFGKCSCLANPTVAAATAAKNGTLTPMPCIPMLNRVWSFGKANLKIMGSRALLDTSANQCMYGGVIKIEDPNVNSVSEGAKLKKVQFVTLEKIGIIKESKAAPESKGAAGAGKGQKFYRSKSERRKALLRDADDPNSGLSQEVRDYIKQNNGNKVPEGYEVSHEIPLYTEKTVEGKKKLDVAKKMKTQQKQTHRDRHKPCGDQFHDFPR